MKQIINALIFGVVAAFVATAQTQSPDSIKTQQLNEIVVEAQLQRTSATVSTYIPTKRQRNAAQNGPELLNHMAIPQLGLISGSSVTTIPVKR